MIFKRQSLKAMGVVLLLLFHLFIVSADIKKPVFGLVIHGGAGTIAKGELSEKEAQLYHQTLKRALQTGQKILQQGGSSVLAVEQVIKILEDSPLFNAGKGAVFTHAGTNELDASVMDGATQKAGAAAGLTRVKNPISLAVAIMNHSQHVFLTGQGAEEFAAAMKLPLVKPEYFYTEKRWLDWQKKKNAEKSQPTPTAINGNNQTQYLGTVGAAALDIHGNLAAGTSTGGMTMKRYGRVGDSPVIGAGTYANNKTCAVSATGHGEYFIRLVVAHTISALMEYKGLSLAQAAEEVIINQLGRMGGDGGVIAMDKTGVPVMVFNTNGMYRGYLDRNGQCITKIFKDE
jgi:beta-aspartyl-peptidase (threonine type)